MISRPSLPSGYSLDPISGLALPNEMRGLRGGGFYGGGGPGRGKSRGSLGTSKPGSVVTVAGGNSLIRGSGDNLPSGGGWSRLFELDVTQADQTVLNTALGSLYNTGFTGDARWVTPSSDKGAYWDQVVGSSRAAFWRWPVGLDQEGWAAQRTFSHATNMYRELYVRIRYAHTAFIQWPSSTIKICLTDPNTGVQLYNLDGGAGFRLAVTNLTAPASEYRTSAHHGGGSADTVQEIELHLITNEPASSANGKLKGWIDGSLITDWNNGGGSNPIDIQYHPSGSVGFAGINGMFYNGGGGSAAMTDTMNMKLATFSAWVRDLI